MVGYRDRTALLHRDAPATTATQLALLSQPVLAGGRQAGTWRRTLLSETARRSASTAQTGRTRVAVTVAWRTLAAADALSLRTAVARYARFLGRDATLVVNGPTSAA